MQRSLVPYDELGVFNAAINVTKFHYIRIYRSVCSQLSNTVITVDEYSGALESTIQFRNSVAAHAGQANNNLTLSSLAKAALITHSITVTYLDVTGEGGERNIIDPASVNVQEVNALVIKVFESTIPSWVIIAESFDYLGIEQDGGVVAKRCLDRAENPPVIRHVDGNRNTFLDRATWRTFQLATYFITVAVSNPGNEQLNNGVGRDLRNSVAHFNFFGDGIDIKNDQGVYTVTSGNRLQATIQQWLDIGGNITNVIP